MKSKCRGLGLLGWTRLSQLLMGAKPDVVFYGCTSATLTHGSEFDKALVGQIKAESGTQTVIAAGALVAALGALGITRIGFANGQGAPRLGSTHRPVPKRQYAFDRWSWPNRPRDSRARPTEMAMIGEVWPPQDLLALIPRADFIAV